MAHFPLLLILVFICISDIHAQQNYSANSVMFCNQTDETGPSPAFLYTCNGQKPSCKAFLIFKSQPPYDSITSISNLTSADPSEVASINQVSRTQVLPPNKEVIVPVLCSCAGKYYQANTTYRRSGYDDLFAIANDTYQGLSTCNSLARENSGETSGMGSVLRVPLRCACPTSNQVVQGTKFLLTYVVTWGDGIHDVGQRFNASVESVADANGLTVNDPVIFPFTTILVPLSAEPTSSETVIHYPPSPYSSPFIPIIMKRTSRKVYIWVGLAISLSVVCFLPLMLLLHRKCRQTSGTGVGGKNKSVLPDDFLDSVAKVDEGLKVYDFEELLEATSDFSTKNKMGASVYRGVLKGEPLAIKEMSKDVQKEVSLLKRINHFNLISLRGACEHHGVFYLIYEFMENGSLKEWLHNKNSPQINIWDCRVQIALDIAFGLHYLHNFSSPAYIHKDICSDNVLLDKNMRAKISNFSVARSAEREESRKSSWWASLGTKGYVAPEYIEYGLVTTEMDVYSFGVVLLELTTGKEAAYFQDGKEVLLSDATLALMEGENADAVLESLLDSRLQGYRWMELANQMMKLGLDCLAAEPESRLSMAEVVSTLLRIQLDVQRSESFG